MPSFGFEVAHVPISNIPKLVEVLLFGDQRMNLRLDLPPHDFHPGVAPGTVLRDGHHHLQIDQEQPKPIVTCEDGVLVGMYDHSFEISPHATRQMPDTTLVHF